MNSAKRILAAGSLAALAGCTTFDAAQDREIEIQRYQIRTLQQEIATLKDQVAGLERMNQDLYKRLDEAGASERADLRDLKAAVGQLRASAQTLEAARAQDRREIVDTLSKMSAAARAAQESATVTGVEHTVEAGQTLSEIAAAYRVSVAVIARANNLSNLNALRVGQKLFIPEGGSARSRSSSSPAGSH
jgi:LysM repeat protein